MQTAPAAQRQPTPRRRLGRLATFGAVALMTVGIALPEAVHAAVEDQRREVERIVDELDRLNEQTDILAEDWAEAEDNLRGLAVEIAAAEERVAAKEAELDVLRGDLSEVALRTLTGSGADVWVRRRRARTAMQKRARNGRPPRSSSGSPPAARSSPGPGISAGPRRTRRSTHAWRVTGRSPTSYARRPWRDSFAVPPRRVGSDRISMHC